MSSNRMFASSPDNWFARLRAWRPEMTVERLTLLVTAFFTLFCNGLFWQAALAGRDWSQPKNWLFALAIWIALTAIHFAAFSLFANRWTVKPLLSVLLVVTAFATYYMQRYHVFYDTSMVRNVLKTDVKEAKELMTPGILPHLFLFAVLPLVVLWRSRLQLRSWKRALLLRIVWIGVAVAVAVGATLLVFQDFSALMRNQREIRHLITPGNYVVSLIRVLAADTAAAGPRKPVGKDAKLAASWAQRDKPAVLVIVVGETARAANWGLNGYARQTTPELAAMDVVNFSQVNSCGTNTEVSVPCMFSPFGRRDYNEKNIRQHESLLHVLDHAGLKVLWRDNQSGCKGVCDGLETQQVDSAKDPKLCDGERCLDEILLGGLADRLKSEKGSLVVVLHQLGNHGPAYFKRYPDAQRRFTPECTTSELGKCTRQEVVNAYDNALLYTDHFLAQTIKLLQAQTSHDAAMIYVSDHGESLGENGIFLHGLPYAIAPREQTTVPMVMWASQSYANSFGLDMNCVKQRSKQEISHDYLFSTVLGLLQVNTQVYDKNYDFAAACRR
ncbi:phosphoethanolamine transferase [Chitinimonas naiadis]